MRIAHITDLHMRQALQGTSANLDRLSRQMPGALSAAVELTNDLGADALILTGDLVDYPLDLVDDPATRQRALRDYRLIAELLDDVACPVVALPGNHDHHELMRQAFGPLKTDRVIANARVVCFPEDAEDDANAPHRAGAAWERMLTVCEDESSLLVMAQHYVVWPDENVDYPHTYVEATAMRSALAHAPGMVLCMSGHFHRGVPLQRHRGVWYAAVPALCVAPHPLWLYDVDEEAISVQEHLVLW